MGKNISKGTGSPESKLAKSNSVSKKLLEKLPPEAILEVAKTASEVLKANKVMEGREQEFSHKIELVKEKNSDRKERINILSSILNNPEVPKDSKSEIVRSICRIAEGNT